ncbi:hypothetical protein TELCIR_22757 [Teladorsagia circumcincta]|uniref:Peptidase A2 domain-containing protein n=1 Tax=Teladorsagia circumcincta TaxID=45464 RepID=A0A2G9TD27_TELCI|nr:hypothetical protein TELCIR_22757 [Teladorsagia circumcincta]
MDSLPALLKAVQQLDLQQRPTTRTEVVPSTYGSEETKIFDNECDELEGKDKVRLLVSRSHEDCHQMLTAAIAPKQPSELSWSEVLEVLDRQFGSAKTLFRRRFECFMMRYDGQEFNNYELLVKTKCTDAKLDIIDFDGLQCLFYVAGFQGSDFADYRTRLSRKLDQSEKVTSKDLTAECQLIKSYKEDSRMLEGDPSINLVRRKKRFRRKKSFNHQRQQKNEPNPACHRSKSKDSMPRQESMPRHESMSRHGSTIHYRRNRHINNVIAALKRDDHPYLDVIINGHATTLLLDTGAEVTIVSEAKWKQFGAPRLEKMDVTGYAANGSPLKFRGCFETDFVVSGSSGGLLFCYYCSSGPGRGTCYVTEDDCNVFGMPWIEQLPDLYKAVRKYQIHRAIVVDHVSSYRDAIVANLRTRFPSVFKPGLGRCTTTKATES